MAIYLDNSATTRVREEVLEAMLPFLSEKWGNSSSIHKLGRQARKALDDAREQVATLLGAGAHEVTFTPCGTHSNNAALIGVARAIEAQKTPRRHLITTAIEHPSCLGPAKYLEGTGWRVTYLPVDSQGLVRRAAFDAALNDDTSIISMMWANNEIGSVQPIAEYAAIARERGIHFHTDAVQVPGRLPLNMAEVAVDTLALSGHKFYAPKGVGVLYVRKGVEIAPLVFGGGQESGLTPGTESIPAIVGIGKAAQLAHAELDEVSARLTEMQQLLFERLAACQGLRITGPRDLKHRLPGHVSFVLRELEGEALVLQMDLKGLMVSSASACHKGIIEPSHVVLATGVSRAEAGGSIRMSAGRYNTKEECEQAVQIFTTVIDSLRASNKTAVG